KDFGWIVVARLDAFEVEDGEPPEASESTRERRIDHRVHRGREHRNAEGDPREHLGKIDVVGLDRIQAGRERDILEAIRRPELVDLGTERAADGERPGYVEGCRCG